MHWILTWHGPHNDQSLKLLHFVSKVWIWSKKLWRHTTHICKGNVSCSFQNVNVSLNEHFFFKLYFVRLKQKWKILRSFGSQISKWNLIATIASSYCVSMTSLLFATDTNGINQTINILRIIDISWMYVIQNFFYPLVFSDFVTCLWALQGISSGDTLSWLMR